MKIRNNITHFENLLKDRNCTLVAVTKTHPVETIMEAYEAGHRDFGENKVQELAAKQPELPHDIRWHFIGHLQRNKVKYIAQFAHLIHAVDSLRLLKEIDKQAAKHGRTIDCLLQIHIAKEETKFGLSESEAEELLSNPELSGLANIRITGLMGMATFTEDLEQVREEFRGIKTLFDDLKGRFDGGNVSFEELSTGMSGDYEVAMEEGSTIIRVGTAVFGPRVSN